MKKRNEGFTLIELIIVIAILAITLALTSDILISLIRSNNKTLVQNELEQQSNFVSLKLEKELRNARNIDFASSDADTLIFTSKDGLIVTYDLDTSSGILSRNSVEITKNHAPGGVSVSCDGTCFSPIDSTPQRVNVSLLFQPVNSVNLGASFKGEVKVDTTIVLRNTY